jgi:predicted RNA-binding Zn ribbon-like protein
MDDQLGKYYKLRLLGGWAALDFANTVEHRGTDQQKDCLENYHDMLRWAYHAAVLDEARARYLLKYASDRRDTAVKAFTNARRLRDTIYELFSLAAAGKHFVLTNLNKHLEKLPPRILRPSGDHYNLGWDSAHDPLESPLWDITKSAADLITSPQLKWVRQCPNCGWLFVDTSRKHNRRWCSMDVCGKQLKSRRQYERVKETETNP